MTDDQGKGVTVCMWATTPIVRDDQSSRPAAASVKKRCGQSVLNNSIIVTPTIAIVPLTVKGPLPIVTHPSYKLADLLSIFGSTRVAAAECPTKAY